jgi:hypothetical protein
MSEATENIKLQLKRGEKGSFDIKNCSAVLAYGEPFWDLDNKNLYIGDGETPLSGLDPINGDIDINGTYIIDLINNTENSVTINGNKIGSAVSRAEIANSLYDSATQTTKSYKDIVNLINNISGIKRVESTGSGNVITKAELKSSDNSTLQITKGIDAIDLNRTGYIDKTSPYDIGGISKGDDLSKLTIVEILNKLFTQKYLPMSNFSFTVETSSSDSTITAVSVTPRFTLGTKPITSFTVGSTDGGNDLLNINSVSSGTTYQLINTKSGTSFTLYASLSDGTTTIKSTTKVELIPLSYWGTLSSNDISNVDSSVVTSLANSERKAKANKVILNYGSVESEYPIYVYPKSYGLLKGIYSDPVNPMFNELTDNYNSKEIQINSIAYYIYLKKSDPAIGDIELLFTY